MLTIFIGVNIPLVEPYDVKVGIHVIAWDLPALVNAGIRGDASIALSSTVCHRQQLQQSQELPRYQKSALPSSISMRGRAGKEAFQGPASCDELGSTILFTLGSGRSVDTSNHERV